MNPSKAWAMLTARGVTFGGVGGGGVPDITPAEVARMLKGLERGPFLAGMVMECGDVKSLPELERRLWLQSVDIACQERWPIVRGQQYCRRLAGLAVFEFVVPHPNRCSACRGRGYEVLDGNGVECTVCQNTGGAKLLAQERSDLAGIPIREWEEGGWSARYETVHSTLLGWYGEALRIVLRAQGDVEEDVFDDERGSEHDC